MNTELISSTELILKKRRELPPSVENAIRYFASGHSYKEASTICSISEGMLRKWLKEPEGRRFLTFLRESLNEEFLNLQSKVNDTLREGLDHADSTIALAAASLWLKASKEGREGGGLSLEDVVQEIMGTSPKKEEIAQLEHEEEDESGS